MNPFDRDTWNTFFTPPHTPTDDLYLTFGLIFAPILQTIWNLISLKDMCYQTSIIASNMDDLATQIVVKCLKFFTDRCHTQLTSYDIFTHIFIACKKEWIIQLIEKFGEPMDFGYLFIPHPTTPQLRSLITHEFGLIMIDDWAVTIFKNYAFHISLQVEQPIQTIIPSLTRYVINHLQNDPDSGVITTRRMINATHYNMYIKSEL